MNAIEEAVAGLRTDAQMAAFGAFVDTQRFRDQVLEVLAQ